MNAPLKKLVMIGFGSIGQAVLPMLMKHFGSDLHERMLIIAADNAGQHVASLYNVPLMVCKLTPENYRQVLGEQLGDGDFLLHLCIDVRSQALVELCYEKNALYLDIGIEPWEGGYNDPHVGLDQHTNYVLREHVLALRKKMSIGPTAVLAHGANPGLVSHFVKKALLQLAEDHGFDIARPTNQLEWARLANALQIKAIHISEKDTQKGNRARQPFEFVSTWSAKGFMAEGEQPAELGWGTHEKTFPPHGKRHVNGCQAAIYLDRPGFMTRVHTWAPTAKSFTAFLVTHNESISLADYLTLKEEGQAVYRPTVHYSYCPTVETTASIDDFVKRDFAKPSSERILLHEIESGVDELGVLLMGPRHQSYWYGSYLGIEEARALESHNNATSMQVAAGVFGGMIWALENPRRGIVEAEQMDFDRVLEVAAPWLGQLVGAYSDWTPLKEKKRDSANNAAAPDLSDPWQFVNFLSE